MKWSSHLTALGIADPAAVREEHITAFLLALREGRDGTPGLILAKLPADIVSASLHWQPRLDRKSVV